MNAFELSDWLIAYAKSDVDYEEKQIEQAATTIRQLQEQLDLHIDFVKQYQTEVYKLKAEIDALKFGDIQWKHAFDLAKIEIADLKAQIEALKANVADKNTSQQNVPKTNNLEHKPFAWYSQRLKCFFTEKRPRVANAEGAIPLYSHPHPDNLGYALSIIEQQKLEIEALKAHFKTEDDLTIAYMAGFKKGRAKSKWLNTSFGMRRK